jgi:hypothetical protein
MVNRSLTVNKDSLFRSNFCWSEHFYRKFQLICSSEVYAFERLFFKKTRSLPRHHQPPNFSRKCIVLFPGIPFLQLLLIILKKKRKFAPFSFPHCDSNGGGTRGQSRGTGQAQSWNMTVKNVI